LHWGRRGERGEGREEIGERGEEESIMGGRMEIVGLFGQGSTSGGTEYGVQSKVHTRGGSRL